MLTVDSRRRQQSAPENWSLGRGILSVSHEPRDLSEKGCSDELLLWKLLPLSRLLTSRVHVHIVEVHGTHREFQELMLILPDHLALHKALAIRRRRRRISDLCKEICSRGFRNSIQKDPK